MTRKHLETYRAMQARRGGTAIGCGARYAPHLRRQSELAGLICPRVAKRFPESETECRDSPIR
ncbi:MAG: hypothetical protein OXI58_19160, partial [Gemmatimonadota bacterium]|nr:hypothetical protein [Gemmatimonadota bacterium]